MGQKTEKITPEMILNAYKAGLFPMAQTAQSHEIAWFNPSRRGILPLEAPHVPRSLRRLLRQHPFTIRINANFYGVITSCAEKTPDRPQTWINAGIIELYTELHRQGFGHSIECWRDSKLVGGVYGLAIAGAFFGESMFSRESGASKVALMHLIARLRAKGYVLFDTQFNNRHIAQFGTREIPRHEYLHKLHTALQHPCQFYSDSDPSESVLLTGFLQSLSQTS